MSAKPTQTGLQNSIQSYIRNIKRPYYLDVPLASSNSIPVQIDIVISYKLTQTNK